MTEERHSYISVGISREAFQDAAIRQTSLEENEDLKWYLHAHNHHETNCNERCQLVYRGTVTNDVAGVTQMDVAKSGGDA